LETQKIADICLVLQKVTFNKLFVLSPEYTHTFYVSTGTLTLTLRRSARLDVDDSCLSTLFPTSERFSELGIATTTTTSQPPLPLIQILRSHRGR